jgi:hypothetical protein
MFELEVCWTETVGPLLVGLLSGGILTGWLPRVGFKRKTPSADRRIAKGASFWLVRQHMSKVDAVAHGREDMAKDQQPIRKRHLSPPAG